MNCSECQECYLDSLTETLPPDVAERLRRHLNQCADCGPWAHQISQLWNELGHLPAPTFSESPDRKLAASFAGSTRWASARRNLVYAATLLLVFWTGWWAAPGPARTGQVSSSESSTAMPIWLLLLHEPAGAPLVPSGSAAEAEAVREYATWAASLARNGQLIRAEKLEDESAIWLPAPGPQPATTISGFFLIRAADRAAALRIADESPHVRRGGTIELRRIDPT